MNWATEENRTFMCMTLEELHNLCIVSIPSPGSGSCFGSKLINIVGVQQRLE